EHPTRGRRPSYGLRRPQGELEHERQIAGRLESRRRLLLEAMVDDVLDVRRDVRVRRQRPSIALHDGVERLDGRLFVEGPRARDQPWEDPPDAEDVRALIGDAAAHLLG